MYNNHHEKFATFIAEGRVAVVADTIKCGDLGDKDFAALNFATEKPLTLDEICLAVGPDVARTKLLAKLDIDARLAARQFYLGAVDSETKKINALAAQLMERNKNLTKERALEKAKAFIARQKAMLDELAQD